MIFKQNSMQNKGFTLIELLMTLAIGGLLTAFAIPSFNKAIANNRLTTNINELVTSLNLARSEAVKRNQPVTVAKIGGEWEQGWVIFTDLDGDGVLDGGVDLLLRTNPALANNYTLRSTAGFVNRATYQATGLSSAGSFVLCDNSDGNNLPEAYTSRVMIVNAVGRVRMGVDSDYDGIPEKNGGEITSCINSPFT